MMLNTEERDYLLHLNASELSDSEIEATFAVIASLPDGDLGHPQSFKGRKVSVQFFLALLHAEANRDFSRLSLLAQSYRDQ